VTAFIDAGSTRRNPILGILLGVAMAGAFGPQVLSAWPEMHALIAQKAPERLTVHEVINLGGARWVTLVDGDWHCEAVTEGPSRRNGGRGSEVPITGTTEGEILVAVFSGAANCTERAGSQLTGVAGSRRIVSAGYDAFREWGPRAQRVAVLEVGDSPENDLLVFVALAAVALGGIGLVAFYALSMFRAS